MKARDRSMCELNCKIQKICEEALRRVTPSREEEIKTLRFVKSLTDRLSLELEKLSLEAEVRVEGSIAKNTWLAGEKDIDLLYWFPKNMAERPLSKFLKPQRKCLEEAI